MTDELEEFFTTRRFLWNVAAPFFPPFFVWDRPYILEKIFPRYHHCFNNNGKRMAWVARYKKI
jgi:hypothetical protein